MNKNNIIIRSATKKNDLKQIKHLFKVAFGDEGVDSLAEILHKHFPGWTGENWFIAEDTKTGQIVSGFCLIPWRWNFHEIPLKVAELGLVATLPEYRGKGLMKLLNAKFNHELEKSAYHLAVIQGIPGFYHRFGYHYATPMEHHVLLDVSSKFNCENGFEFRQADNNDINFLIEQDRLFSQTFDISVFRSHKQWKYLLSHSKKTEYGSEYWIIENKDNNEKYYCRIALQGFGSGLIIAEVSEGISMTGLKSMLCLVNKLAIKKQKPFLRFNLPNESQVVEQLLIWGANKNNSYRWQIKMPNISGLLQTMKPIFESRLEQSSLKGFTGIYHLNFYTFGIDIIWQNGKITEVVGTEPNEVQNRLNVTPDLFIPLCLGSKTWNELQDIRPDIFPGQLSTNPTSRTQNYSRELTEILYPKLKTWINCQY